MGTGTVQYTRPYKHAHVPFTQVPLLHSHILPLIRVQRVQVPRGDRVHARFQHASINQRLPALPFTLPILVSFATLHCIASHCVAFARLRHGRPGSMAHPSVQVCGNRRLGDVTGDRAGALQFIGCGYGQLQPVNVDMYSM